MTKKINYLSVISFIEVIIITLYFDTSIAILKQNVDINSWICIILSYILGIIPLSCIIYISKYEPNLNFFDKNIKIFGKALGNIINIYISTILFIIAMTILFNICDFITSQFLYHTPIIISMILITLLSIYNNIKEKHTISKVSYLLTTFNFILFTTSFLSLISKIDITNFLPILKENTKNIIPTTLKLTSINILPLIIILIIPKSSITNYKNYDKTLILSYIIGCIISLLIIIETYGILGKYLIQILEYPEYMLLKKVKFFGVIERAENIISIEWITSSYIYITLIIHSISKNINTNKKTYTYILIGILLITITKIIFKNNSITTTFCINILPYITGTLFPLYLIITIKIFLQRKKI